MDRISSRNDRGEAPGESPLRFFLIRFLITLAVSLVLLLIAATADYLTADPNGNARPFALAALYLSAIIGGILVSPSDLPFFLSGLIPGSAYLLLLSAISLGLPDSVSSHDPFLISLLLHLAVVADVADAPVMVGVSVGYKNKLFLICSYSC